ncbi:hypothetical protein IEU95_15855 [Hoyosella rhizosphaerae]|uniref:EVE domain-containing protein n=1 Tax=Hoyosella rhizosphaerae TaxID=1755582 RepID=A0A916XIF0_9ACTN|nr:hypothetical protein [Hoyosella rhizosphaerae]MBN4928310.1 hypothetical protein [Hoyosella rhizosphaerae]GGC73980.1 hypothetical protein GCM10011410_28970 [Hoyosella rhizosphaerae]
MSTYVLVRNPNDRSFTFDRRVSIIEATGQRREALDSYWAYANLSRIVVGDRVFLYSALPEQGIIGSGTIAATKPVPSGGDFIPILWSAMLDSEDRLTLTKLRSEGIWLGWFPRQSGVTAKDADRLEQVWREHLKSLRRKEPNAKSRNPVRVPAEKLLVEKYEVSSWSNGTALRAESKMCAAYKDYLELLGHTVERWTIPVGDTTLYTDLFDVTQKRLYEAKASTGRDAVRMAIGQLLDYQRFLSRSDVEELCLLLPDRPSDDLLALLQSIDVGCVYPTGDGCYTEV